MPQDLGVLSAGRDALRHALDTVAAEVFGPGRQAEIACAELPGEPVDLAAATALPTRPFQVGDVWGPRWGTAWFRIRAQVPRAWVGSPVVLRFENVYVEAPVLGGEALLYLGGRALEGLNAEHPYAVLPVEAGGEAELWVEAAANPLLGAAVGRWPLLLPDPGGPALLRLYRCEIAVRRPEVAALHADLRVALGVAEHGGPDARRAELAAAVSAACAVLDPGDVPGTAAAARAELADALRVPVGAGMQRVTAVGHAHLDTAWLWPLRETARKAARTLATVLALAAEDPDYVFALPAARHALWVRDQHPELFARLVAAVGRGQVVPVGGMWVEPDLNMPSGESLLRQFAHGQRFFEREFGVTCREAWLPDSFGMPASIPTILAAAGVHRFVTQKLSWNDTNVFPHHTFWWEGLDGTRVLACFPTSDTYNGMLTPINLARGLDNARLPVERETALHIYGHGDGGGGPTREMLENAHRMADLAGIPAVSLAGPERHFAAMEAQADELPVWVGELYLEKHRGTYTSQATVKRLHRRAERLLAAAELWSAAAPGLPWPAARLDEAWQLLLTNEFHDILPGSSIHWVYEEAERDLTSVGEIAAGLADNAMQVIAALVDAEPGCPLVFNASPFPRSELLDVAGRPVPVEVPALGWAVLAGAAPAIEVGTVEVGDRVADNGLLGVRWDAAGRLTSVFDHRAGREVLGAGERGNVFHLHVDDPADYDAWDLDPGYLDEFTALDGPAHVDVVEAGPLRAHVRMRREFGHSTIDQVMVVSAGSRRIDFRTVIDWHEDHRMLKVAFPIGVRATQARFDIQFGHVTRATHANTSFEQARFEVCAHRWAEVSEDGFGAALLNDGRYGYDVRGSVLRLSLLRAPTAPDPRCDRRRHELTYSLLPFTDLREVLAAGAALNIPLVATTVPSGGARGLPVPGCVVSSSEPGFVIETVKRADDGDGLVVRGYEALGGRRRVAIKAAGQWQRAWRADARERDIEEVPVDGCIVALTVGAFELVTLRLR
ncbi:MAG: alpha-mannosidase [Frankiaceae bacterium]